jgi:diguanylate cyclase (GGDEF)-like protein
MVEELDTRYRVEQIEREVEVLRLDGALKQATLRQRNLLLMLLGAGLLLSAVGAFLGWRGYRIERRLELALTARNQELEVALARIAELARTDPLTGLMNRRSFEEQATREMAKARRNGTSLVLAMADIDHFKPLNDQFGHAAGDEVLRQLAARLRSGLRESDLVCRWGGEEFVCLLVDVSVGDAAGALERLRYSLDRQPIIIAPGAQPVRLTIGLTQLEAGLDEALAAADAALYEGKRAGRDRVITAAAGASATPGEG